MCGSCPVLKTIQLPISLQSTWHKDLDTPASLSCKELLLPQAQVVLYFRWKMHAQVLHHSADRSRLVPSPKSTRHLSRLKANGGLLFSPEVLCSLSNLVPTEGNAFWDTEWTEINVDKGKTLHHSDESQCISKLTVKFILGLYSRFREATEWIFPQGRLHFA